MEIKTISVGLLAYLKRKEKATLALCGSPERFSKR